MVKKTIFILGIIILGSFFILGCRTSEKTKEFPENKTEENLTLELCDPQWQCLNASFKTYQLENCSWSNQTKCSFGCLNGTCQPAPCLSGFKCKDPSTWAFQLENCSWTQETECEWGCANNSCSSQPEEETTEEEIILKQISRNTLNTLPFGEIHTLEINEKQYNISLYNLEAERAIVKINNFKSEWISENQNFTYTTDLIFSLEEIYFQAFYGGKRNIVYQIR